MFERRPFFGLLIILVLCITIWMIIIQETQRTETEFSSGFYNNLNQKEFIFDYDRIKANHQQQRGRDFSATVTQSYLNIVLKEHLLLKENSHLLAANNRNSNRESNINNFAKSLLEDDRKQLINLNNFEYLINHENICKRSTFSTTSRQKQDDEEQPQYKKSTLSTPYSSSRNPSHLKPTILPQVLPTEKLLSSSSSSSSPSSSFVYNKNNSSNEFINNPLVLILIHSAPKNNMKRLLIRETWGSFKNQNYLLLFLLGAVGTNEEQKAIESENQLHFDIIQGNFVDSYQNLTYKHVMALKWFIYYCSDAKFIVKVDDDIFVNTPYLIEFATRTTIRNDLLFCQKHEFSRISRSYRSKWRVSFKEYPGTYYPTYCPGYAIVYSSDVAFKLYNEAQRYTYFWIDDVHLTGTLRANINIEITSFLRFLLSQEESDELLTEEEKNLTLENDTPPPNSSLIFSPTSASGSNESSNSSSNSSTNNNSNSSSSSSSKKERRNQIKYYLFLFTPPLEKNTIERLWRVIENGIR